MKRFQVTLAPSSFFRTPIRGDILFGHLCWQFATYPQLVRGGLEGLLSRYSDEPDIIVSDPIYLGSVNNYSSETNEFFVSAPPECCFEESLSVARKRHNNLSSSVSANTVVSVNKDFVVNPSLGTVTKSPIQRKIGCELNSLVFKYPEKIVIDVLVNSAAITACGVEAALTNVGKFGYGGGASRGFGRFTVENIVDYEVPCNEDVKWWLTLAPSVPTSQEAQMVLFESLKHYGYHSSQVADNYQYNKKGIRLAAAGAVIFSGSEGGGREGKDRSKLRQGYCGRALNKVSLAHNENTIQQGYSSVYPLQLSSTIEQFIVNNAVFRS